MPSERRLITFTKKEVEAAMRRFAYSQDRKLPQGEPSALDFHGKGEDGVSVKLAFNTDGETRAITFTELETAAALIGYCAKLKVPVPRQGRKSVRLKNGDLALQIDVPQR